MLALSDVRYTMLVVGYLLSALYIHPLLPGDHFLTVLSEAAVRYTSCKNSSFVPNGKKLCP